MITLPLLKPLARLALLALPCATIGAVGQTAPSAPRPIAAMPYSPSLDVTSLDRSVEPCADFYKFSCGGWMKKNPIPADQAGWSVYAKLANDNQQFLWGILEADAKLAKRNAVQQKVGDYFAACMNTAAIDARGAKPIEPALVRINSLDSNKAIAAALPALDQDVLGSFFFSVGTGQDAVDSSVVIVEVYPGGLGLPDRDYYTKTDPKSVKLREQYVEFIQKLLTLSGEAPAQARSDADATLKIETALAKAQLTRVERRDPHKTYHMMSVAELSALTPSIDWKAILRLNEAKGVSRLNVSQPEAMKAIEAELVNEPVAALQGYLRFHAAAGAAPVLASPLEKANFDFYSTTLRGVPAEPPRWKTCVRGVDRSLGEALGQEFVARTFGAEMKANTQRMTEQIEKAMQTEIEGLDWMSPRRNRKRYASCTRSATKSAIRQHGATTRRSRSSRTTTSATASVRWPSSGNVAGTSWASLWT